MNGAAAGSAWNNFDAQHLHALSTDAPTFLLEPREQDCPACGAILTFDHRGALSVESENATAAYECSDIVSAVAEADPRDDASPVRLVVEVKRNLGGMQLRAQIGASSRSARQARAPRYVS